MISSHRTDRIAIETIKVLRAALIVSVLVVLLTHQIINTAPLCRASLPLLVLSAKDRPSNACSTTCSNAVSTPRGPISVALRQLLLLIILLLFSSAFRWSFICIFRIAHIIIVKHWLNSLSPSGHIRIIGRVIHLSIIDIASRCTERVERCLIIDWSL